MIVVQTKTGPTGKAGYSHDNPRVYERKGGKLPGETYVVGRGSEINTFVVRYAYRLFQKYLPRNYIIPLHLEIQKVLLQLGMRQDRHVAIPQARHILSHKCGFTGGSFLGKFEAI